MKYFRNLEESWDNALLAALEWSEENIIYGMSLYLDMEISMLYSLVWTDRHPQEIIKEREFILSNI